MKPAPFKIGDMVTIIRVPAGLDDRARIDTPGVFQRALGGTFRVAGVDNNGHLELVVTERRPTLDTFESDTVWVEPDCVILERRGHAGD